MNALSKPEWAIMAALWENPKQPVSGIISAMGGEFAWKYTTYATYLKRMTEKGLIGFEQLGRDKFYYAIPDKSECIRAESRSVLEKIDAQAKKELLVCMIREGGLSVEDTEELRRLLDGLGTREGEP